MNVKLVTSPYELEQILTLQKRNLFENVSSEVKQQQGFVTVKHTLELLTQMNNKTPQIIASVNEHVVGYALVMLNEFQKDIPVLQPMFEMFDQIEYEGTFLSKKSFYVMGQICIAEAHRGKGLFNALYQKHKEVYSSKFDLLITEVSTSNSRSMRAHEKVGFKTVYTYTDHTDDWNIMVWDWS